MAKANASPLRSSSSASVFLIFIAYSFNVPDRYSSIVSQGHRPYQYILAIIAMIVAMFSIRANGYSHILY